MSARYQSVSATILHGASLIILSALSFPMTAYAQSSDTASADGGREEIVVTARRRSEELTQVPASITAFTAADIEKMGVQEPSDFLNMTSGVFFRANTTAGTSFINIRGVTQARNAESAVAVVVDGVFLNNPLAFQNQLVDIQQIEVLKGPQGALYGRNASAGAIIVTTTEPSNDFSGVISAGIGRHMTYKAETAFGGAIVPDKLLFRASFYARGTNGFLKNQFLSSQGNNVYGDAQDDVGGRLRFVYNASDALKFDLRLAHTETKGPFNLTIFDPTNSGDDAILDVIPFEPNVRGFNKRKTDDISLKIDFETDIATITSVSAWNRLKEGAGGDSLPYSRSSADGTQFLINEYETWSQELRITSTGEGPFRWLGGAYYQKTDRFFGSSSGTDTGSGIVVIDRTGTTNGPGTVNPASGGILGTDIDQKAWAVFASLAYDLTDRLELSGALRYDRDKEIATNTGPFGPGFVPNPLLGNKRKLVFSKWQPKVTLRYTLNPDASIFLNYAQGFKNGGFNPEGSRATALIGDPNTPIQDFFNAETTTTYEAGFKGRFLDRRLNVALTGYFNEIKGANYFDFLVASATQMNLNIDKVEAYGLELDVNARVTDAITLSGAFSYIKNEIKKYDFIPATVGKTSPYFPNISFNLAANWEDYITDNLRGTFRIEYQHIGRVYWDLQEQVRRPSLNFIDLRAGVIQGEDDDAWRFEVYCRNCTNKRYINETVFLSQLGLSVQFPTIDARVYGIEFSKRF